MSGVAWNWATIHGDSRQRHRRVQCVGPTNGYDTISTQLADPTKDQGLNCRSTTLKLAIRKTARPISTAATPARTCQFKPMMPTTAEGGPSCSRRKWNPPAGCHG
jgi:hypothetical protein